MQIPSQILRAHSCKALRTRPAFALTLAYPTFGVIAHVSIHSIVECDLEKALLGCSGSPILGGRSTATSSVLELTTVASVLKLGDGLSANKQTNNDVIKFKRMST